MGDFDAAEIQNAETFFALERLFSYQQKACDFQKYVSIKLGVEMLDNHSERGDFYDEVDDKYVELKCSFTNKGGNLNIRQIRAWQNIDEYWVLCINEDFPKDSSVYVLTRQQMIDEVNRCGTPSHGKKKDNVRNANVESSITIPMSRENPKLKRWNENYANKELFDKIFK